MRINDIQTQSKNGKEYIFFTSSIANLGTGPFEVYSEKNLGADSTNPTSKATQKIYDENFNVAQEKFIGNFVYHAQHRHWHLYTNFI